MSKKKFAVGDRVAVYLAAPSHGPFRELGTVDSEPDSDGDIWIEFDDGDEFYVNLKQCRRLRRKNCYTMGAARQKAWVKKSCFNDSLHTEMSYSAEIEMIELTPIIRKRLNLPLLGDSK